MNLSFLREVWFVVRGNRLTSTLTPELLVLFWCHAALAFKFGMPLEIFVGPGHVEASRIIVPQRLARVSGASYFLAEGFFGGLVLAVRSCRLW